MEWKKVAFIKARIKLRTRRGKKIYNAKSASLGQRTQVFVRLCRSLFCESAPSFHFHKKRNFFDLHSVPSFFFLSTRFLCCLFVAWQDLWLARLADLSLLRHSLDKYCSWLRLEWIVMKPLRLECTVVGTKQSEKYFRHNNSCLKWWLIFPGRPQ